MFEVRVAGRADPLQKKVGKNRGVKPGNQEQQRYCLPTGQAGRQPVLPRRKERSYLYGITHSALTFENMRNWVIAQSKTSTSGQHFGATSRHLVTFGNI